MSFQAIQWAIAEAPVTNPVDQHVLMILAHHAQPDGTEVYPSTSTLVKETKLGRSTLFRTLTRLKEQGLITSVGERGRGVVAYRLNMTSIGAAPVPERDGSAVQPVPERDGRVPERDVRPVPERDPEEPEGNSQRTENPPTPLTRGVTPLRWAPDGGGPRNGRPRRRLSRVEQTANRAAELRARAAALRAEQAAATEREGPPADPVLQRTAVVIPAVLEEAVRPRPSVRPASEPPSPELPAVQLTVEQRLAIREAALARHVAARAPAGSAWHPTRSMDARGEPA